MTRRTATFALLILGVPLMKSPAHGESGLGPFTARDLDCLARNIYHEARNQPLEGQLAIAHVTLNRLEASRGPRTICDIVYRRGWFSWTRDSNKLMEQPAETAAWEMAQRIARTAIADPAANPVQGSTFFHSVSVAPSWAPAMTPVGRIGDHIFYVRREREGREAP